MPRKDGSDEPDFNSQSFVDNLPPILAAKLREVYSKSELDSFEPYDLKVAIGIQASLIELADGCFDEQRLASFTQFIE